MRSRASRRPPTRRRTRGIIEAGSPTSGACCRYRVLSPHARNGPKLPTRHFSVIAVTQHCSPHHRNPAVSRDCVGGFCVRNPALSRDCVGGVCDHHGVTHPRERRGPSASVVGKPLLRHWHTVSQTVLAPAPRVFKHPMLSVSSRCFGFSGSPHPEFVTRSVSCSAANFGFSGPPPPGFGTPDVSCSA